MNLIILISLMMFPLLLSFPCLLSFPRKRESRQRFILNPRQSLSSLDSRFSTGGGSAFGRRGNDIFFLTLMFSFFYGAVFAQGQAPTEITQKIENLAGKIKFQTGFEILYKDLPAAKADYLSFELANPEDYPALLQYLEILDEEMSRYPKAFWLKFSNPKILLVKKHFFHEKPAEGVFPAKSDTLILDFSRSRRNPTAQRHSIHHEIFHLVDFHIHGPDMDEDKAWENLNAPVFQYRPENISDWIKNDGSAGVPTSKGFVTDYAMTSAAEDKAEVFACLMVPVQKRLINRWAQTDKILERKIEAIRNLEIKFYGGFL